MSDDHTKKTVVNKEIPMELRKTVRAESIPKGKPDGARYGLGDEQTAPTASEAYSNHMQGDGGVTIEQLQRTILDLMEENHKLENTSSLERRLAASVLRYCPVGISIYDSSGRLIAANKKHVEITGVQAKGQTIEDMHASQYGDHIRLDGTKYQISEYPVMRTLRTGEHVKSEFMIAAYPKVQPQGCLLNISTAPILNERKEIAAAIRFCQVVATGNYPSHNTEGHLGGGLR